MRKIIHVDMDCFFAAVEMRDNPALRDIPIAIGGSRVQRGVISTANYPARKFGVRSAMPTAMALKLCPHLTLLPGRFDAYKEASSHIREIFSRYTSLIEPLSLDEAYLDVSDSVHCQGSATLIAEEIRQTIFHELQLTASAGIAPVKFLAKIASDMNKPNGQFVIAPLQLWIEVLNDALTGRPLVDILHQRTLNANRFTLSGVVDLPLIDSLATLPQDPTKLTKTAEQHRQIAFLHIFAGTQPHAFQLCG